MCNIYAVISLSRALSILKGNFTVDFFGQRFFFVFFPYAKFTPVFILNEPLLPNKSLEIPVHNRCTSIIDL